MSNVIQFRRQFAACPLVAILRGIPPAECEEVGEALVETGIGIIEVPLNSPDPFESIAKLRARLGDRALVGAGTVLDPEQVARVAGAGGQIVVSPNVDQAVIRATVAAGLVSAPGYFTPTEAFAALEAGANALKLFPGEAAGPVVVKAQRAVLPRAALVIVVGGVTPQVMASYLDAGASGFGLGSGLYRPGDDAAAVRRQAMAYTRALP
ncbi:2-dehydro-3-deoxy-6-phosphogalactonate aldolase [Tsuneonella sp. HG249]